MSARTRALLSRALLVVAGLAAVVTLVTGYAQWVARDSGRFADRATVALQDDAVRGLLAERITDGVILERGKDLIVVRPLIESATSSAIGSRAFARVFRGGVRDLHAALVSGDADTLTLTLTDIGLVLAGGLQAVRPEVAAEVRATERVAVASERLGAVGESAAAVTRAARVAAWVAFAVMVLAGAGSLLLAADRRRRVVHLGLAATAAGAGVLVAWGVARSVVVARADDPAVRAATGAVWDAFMGDLRSLAWVVAGSGAVVAAAAASLIRQVDVTMPIRRALAVFAAEPRTPWLRVARAVVLVAAGVVLLVARDAVVDALLTVAGLYLIYTGVGSLLRMTAAPRERERDDAARAPAARRTPRPWVAAAVAAVPVVVAVALFWGSADTEAALPPRGACNGSEALCDRTLEEVALPATHNSMSAPLPGWFRPEQDRPIPGQLRDGVRGLLIDTWYADRLPNGRLRTDLGDEEDLRARAAADGVSPEAVDAALRIRGRAGFGGRGVRGIYLCHGFCEVGATPLAPVLRQIRDFLVANPGEVVLIVNQDQVTPEDFVAAVRDAGLEPLVYRGPTEAGAWPTLGEMIDRDERLVIMAEQNAGVAPWYHPAYRGVLQETPFLFRTAPPLTDPGLVRASCVPNRGTADAPLFLMNHWVTQPVPRPSDAARVNTYEVLLRRARECERIRGRAMNLLAVDFYLRGDVFRVADTLNGLD